MPTVVARQRVPFDWTLRGAVDVQNDKTLADRAAEMRAQYEAMREDNEGSALALGAGLGAMAGGGNADASLVCVLM